MSFGCYVVSHFAGVLVYKAKGPNGPILRVGYGLRKVLQSGCVKMVEITKRDFGLVLKSVFQAF